MPFRAVRPALRRDAYIVLLTVLALLGSALWLRDHLPPLPGPVAVLAAMAFFTESRKMRLSEPVAVSLTCVLLLASAVLVGPLGAVVTAVIAFPFSLRPTRVAARAFNTALSAAIGVAAGWVYALLGGWMIGDRWAPDRVVLHVVLPLAAAALAMYVLNAVLLAGVMHLTDDHPAASVRATTRSLLRRSMLNYLVAAVASFLFLTLWVGAGLMELSALLMAAPLFLAQWALQGRAAGRVTQRRSVELFAHLSTVYDPSREAAVETATQLTRSLGIRLNLLPHEVDELSYAASLAWLGEIDARRGRTDARHRASRVEALLRGVPSLEQVRLLLRYREVPWSASDRPPEHLATQTAILAVATAAADGVDIAARSGTRFAPQVVSAYRQTEDPSPRHKVERRVGGQHAAETRS